MMPDQPLDPTPNSDQTLDVDQNLPTDLTRLYSTIEDLRRQNAEWMALCQELEDDRRRYREVFDLALDGYVLTDLDGVILDANHTAAALLGMRQESLRGRSLLWFIDEAAQASLLAQIAQWRSADHGTRRGPPVCAARFNCAFTGARSFRPTLR